LFATYEYPILPGAQIFPFDATPEWPPQKAERPMDSNYRWTMIPVTMSGCPAISVPVDFNDEGLPMGVQIMSRNGEDLPCLELAKEATHWIDKGHPRLL
jgi:amidase